MPVNETAALETTCVEEVGVAVDRDLHERALPGALLQGRRRSGSRDLAEREEGAARSAARAALSEYGRARSQRAQLARLRRRVKAPVKTLPFLFEPELGAEAARRLSKQARLMPSARRHPREQGNLHLRGIGRGRQDDHLGGDRRRDGRRRTEGLRADDRPGKAARRLARAEGAEQRGKAGRPEACSKLRGSKMEGELWAMMLDAKATFDELIARQAPDEESRDRVLENRIYQQISNALAGSQEYMAMEKLFELHTRGALRPARPRHAAEPQRARLPRGTSPPHPVHRRQIAAVFMRADRLRGAGCGRGASVMLSVLKRIVGFDLIADLAEFFNAFSGMVDGFQAGPKRVNRLLADRRHLLSRRLRPTGRADRRSGLLPPQTGRGKASFRRRDRQQGPLSGRATPRRGAEDLPLSSRREAWRRGPETEGDSKLRRLPGPSRARR